MGSPPKSEAAKEAARVRNRRWREAHRDELLERARQKRAADPERYRSRNREWYSQNRAQHLAKSKQYAKERPNIHVLYQHGVTPDELEMVYRAQGGRCAICDREAPMRGPGCLFIDHDHETGVRRGLICHECNKALPVLERVGPTWALRALAYLGDPPMPRIRRRKAS